MFKLFNLSNKRPQNKWISLKSTNALADLKGKPLTCDRNFLYFTDSDATSSLYRMDLKTKVKMLITRETPTWCEEFEEVLYFLSEKDNLLYTINKDGTGKQTLSSDEVINPTIYDKSIYFINKSHSCRLFRYDLKTSSLFQVIDEEISKFILYKNFIYFRNVTDGGKLYKISFQGTNRNVLDNASIFDFDILNDIIYYSTGHLFHGTLNKMKIDGTAKLKLTDDLASWIRPTDTHVFYCNCSDKNNLYRITNSGTDKKKLNEDTLWYIDIVDKWIYYKTLYDDKMYRILANGTHREMV